LLVGCVVAPRAVAIPAFPGAEGFGGNATGGRGGEVFHVSNLANTNTGTYEGPNGYNRGTLRWALLSEVSSLPRTIVFDVGGQVTLNSQITMEHSNITLAGQTAPGQGLTTAGRPWLIESGGNLVIRYIRNRLGRNGGQDSMGVEGGSNMIFDHVTSTWSNDEALSVAKDGTLVTVQNSLIYEGLNHSGHGYGSLIRPDINSQVTYHHNLYANNESRNPRPGTYNNRTLEFDFRNNVIYNWGHRAGYTGGSEGSTPEPVNMNFVGNYTIAGPSTHNNWNSAFVISTNGSLRAYQTGNLIDSDLDMVRDGVDTGWNQFEVEAGSLTQMAAPFAFTGVPVTTQSAADAYDSVLDYAGSFWWNRDTHDARVVNQVRTQTGSIIDHEDDVGGFLPPPTVSRDVATWDSDYDGMPNHWELAHGLNPNLSTDRNNDFDSDGYTNLEEYINEVGAWPAPRPITWTGGSGRYALNQNWDTWQPSRFDELRINSGTATVDAIGQHAGLVKIGTNAGENATLNITGGRFEVAAAVVIGADPDATAALNLSGGKLVAGELFQGDGGLFSFTGGVLSAGAVHFDLVNQGGTIAPGSSVSMTVVMGNLDLPAGSLQIELSSATQVDRLVVAGDVMLGGALDVALIDGFTMPESGSWEIITAGGNIGGNFASITDGFSVQKQGDSLMLLVGAAPVLAGDYNNDGVVDAADYTAWRDNLGAAAGTLPNDADGGQIGPAQFNTWVANFGATGPGGLGSAAHLAAGDSAAANYAVPEPASWALCLSAVTAAIVARSRRRPADAV
jgi:hypothetical protein